MKVTVYMLDWHLTVSPAFEKIFLEPLSVATTYQLVAWDGKEIRPEWLGDLSNQVFVFCQKLPPALLLKQSNANIVWLPMWNNVRRMSKWNWSAFPNTMKVIAYCANTEKMSRWAGLKTLALRYAPEARELVNWNQGRVLYYWNRCGLISLEKLRKICRLLKIEKILFRPDLDPGLPKELYYNLGLELDGIPVETVPMFNSHQEAMEKIQQANIVIAPRPFEGVGLIFLEAMARGCAVLAAKQATMSDYIIHGETGLLLRTHHPRFAHATMVNTKLSNLQWWPRLAFADVEKIGRNAHHSIEKIHFSWINQMQNIAKFIL